MSRNFKLIIPGDPFGKQRPKASSANGFVRTYTPKETVNYESKVVAAYRDQYSEPMFRPHEELWASITAYFPITKGHYVYHKRTQTTDLDKEGELMKAGKVNPTKTPDCDNIAKVCLDALNGIAYPDDSAITCLVVFKRYSEQPRVEIIVERPYGLE